MCRFVRTATDVLSALTVAAGMTGSAHAQSMVPPAGAGAVSVTYQTAQIKDHIFVERTVDVGHITSHALMVDFGVGLGRNFALSAAVPLVAARYDGVAGHRPSAAEAPLHPTFEFIDNGRYNVGVQDLRFELRYATSHNGLHLMPFVSVMLPSHAYEYLGHAALGKRIREIRAGIGLHRLLTPLSARSYVQAHLAYGFLQKVAGVPRGVSHLNLEGGYFWRPDLTVFGVASIHLTHGGIDIHNSLRAEYSGELFIHHDRIVREQMINVGGGAAWTIAPGFLIVGSVTRTVWGVNSHAQAYVVTLGFSKGFGGAHGH